MYLFLDLSMQYIICQNILYIDAIYSTIYNYQDDDLDTVLKDNRRSAIRFASTDCLFPSLIENNSSAILVSILRFMIDSSTSEGRLSSLMRLVMWLRLFPILDARSETSHQPKSDT